MGEEGAAGSAGEVLARAAAAGLARRLAAVARAPGAESPRLRLEALAGERLRAFDEARAELGGCLPDASALAATGEGGEAVSPFLAAGAAALADIVNESFVRARAEGSTPLLGEEEACLALWAMLEAVVLAAARRGDKTPLAGKARSAGLALEIMLRELSGLDARVPASAYDPDDPADHEGTGGGPRGPCLPHAPRLS